MTYTFPMPGPEPEKNKPIQYTQPVPEIQGWIDPIEMNWLYGQASKMDSVVEIGCWKGRSTHVLLSGCPGTVYAVDHFKGSPNERNGPHQDAVYNDIGSLFFKNVGYFENLVLLEMDSVKAARKFKKLSVDMVWIDGGHDYDSIMADLKAWWPKCRKLLCGHDATQDGVPKALAEMEPTIGKHQRAGAIWYIERSL